MWVYVLNDSTTDEDLIKLGFKSYRGTWERTQGFGYLSYIAINELGVLRFLVIKGDYQNYDIYYTHSAFQDVIDSDLVTLKDIKRWEQWQIYD
jgi:hypothetical protein